METDEVVAEREPQRRLPVLSWALPAAAVIVLVVSLALGGLLYRQHSKENKQADAVTAARQVLINAYSVDYKTVANDYRRFVNSTTGDLHSELTASTSKFVSTVTSTHTHETAKVVDAGLVRYDGSTATVAVALDSPLTSTAATTPQARQYRTEVDVQRVGKRWLATAIRQVN